MKGFYNVDQDTTDCQCTDVAHDFAEGMPAAPVSYVVVIVKSAIRSTGHCRTDDDRGQLGVSTSIIKDR